MAGAFFLLPYLEKAADCRSTFLGVTLQVLKLDKFNQLG